jgi:hypothetical protein
MCNITSLAQPLFGVIVPSPNPGQNVGKILQQQEELAQRGQELYESCIRSKIEVGNDGKIVAIDIELGEFEVDETVMGATDWLFKT